MKPAKFRIALLLVVIYLAFIGLGLPDSLLGTAWPGMRSEFGAPVSYAGILSTLISGCTIVSSLLSGRLSERISDGVMTAASVGMTALALWGFATADSFAALCLWAFPYGLGAGSVDTVLNHFVASRFEAKHMNWLHCFWGIGAALGPYVTRASLLSGTGWRGGYGRISLIQLALTMILLLSLPLWKKASGARTDEAGKERTSGIRELFRLPGAKKVLIAFFCYCSLEQVTGLWCASYLIETKGVAAERAAFLLGLFYLAITAGRFVSGFLTVVLKTDQVIRLGLAILLAGLLFLNFSRAIPALELSVLLIGLGCAPIYPCLLRQTPERFGEKASRPMMGLQMAFVSIGGTLSPPIVGAVSERAGLGAVIVFQLFFWLALVITSRRGNAYPLIRHSEIID